MKEADLVYPIFAMVLLTAAVLAILFRSRVRAVREGEGIGALLQNLSRCNRARLCGKAGPAFRQSL